jgi:hypothetical protein
MGTSLTNKNCRNNYPHKNFMGIIKGGVSKRGYWPLHGLEEKLQGLYQ